MNYQICTNCVMDTTNPQIVFDDKGVCNHCHQAQSSLEGIEKEKSDLPIVVEEIKKSGGKYDCIIGLSGGVDSSILLHKAVYLGLKPLCFTVNNGWNDPKADENIMRLVEGLKVPFEAHVLDKKSFVRLQNSFMKAGVPNIEIPTDHVLMAVSLDLASRYGIKYILSGGNVATESIMPPAWGYNARDLVHIKAIHKGKIGVPTCSLLKWNWYRWVKKIRTIYLLDYFDYNREESIKLLQEKYGWQPYGEKHCENVFTTWFQNFYLYEKFGYDKRKAHLSSLINSGQMTRKEAMFLLTANPVYPELGIESKVMSYPKRSHDDFPKDNYDVIAKWIRRCKF